MIERIDLFRAATIFTRRRQRIEEKRFAKGKVPDATFHMVKHGETPGARKNANAVVGAESDANGRQCAFSIQKSARLSDAFWRNLQYRSRHVLSDFA